MFAFSGPGFNLFLRKINFTVGDVIIDKYSAPGVSISLRRIFSYHWLNIFNIYVLICDVLIQVCLQASLSDERYFFLATISKL